MKTSLFTQNELPAFHSIEAKDIFPTIQGMLEQNKATLQRLLDNKEGYTWENLMHPLEEMNDTLSKAWSPISHLRAVTESDELRTAYNKVLPLLTEYHTEISQNEALYKAIASIANGPEFNKLDAAQRKIIENDMRDFKLAGIHLPADKKARLAELEQTLSQLTTKFSENILDATNAWYLRVEDESTLEGLPPQALELAKENAKLRNLTGFVFTLDYPSYSTAIQFLKNRGYRETLYNAYVTRASDQGPFANKWDNTRIMQDILAARLEIAKLVGFDTFADYSLATKMAKKPTDVLHFLHDLVQRCRPMAIKEYQALRDLAKADGIDELQSWDAPYYSEQLQLKTFHFTQEDVRPYFPIDKALSGLFAIVKQLYGITVTKQTDIETWHPDAQFFALHDESGNLRGGFYIDLYARQKKRDGAWMDECRTRKLNADKLQLPVAYLTCNFMPPVDGQPALLTHDDVLTLFHEFGHCLHHMLTKVNYPSVAGINGVPWDAVEFPSQFMENFCWEKESLALIAGHFETGAPLPDDLYEKMLAAKHFQTGLQMLRQLEFSLFDFRLHLEFDPSKTNQTQTILDEVRDEVSVVKPPVFNRFQNSFSHIFAGGYAAGYYSYKWAEVLSSDAYAQFEENGIFDAATGRAFMQHILEIGGTRDPMEAFTAFRGREPQIDALLRHSGVVEG